MDPSAFATDDGDEERRRGALTPFIDIIFLLLVFFVLTTRFVPEEEAIAHLLPTTSGGRAEREPLVPPEDLVIALTPVGVERGWDLDRLDRHLRRHDLAMDRRVTLHALGEHRTVALGSDDGAYLGAIHDFVRRALSQLEDPAASRDEQAPVRIHCFSELPWRHALAAYDAVRAYEFARAPEGDGPRASAFGGRDLALAPAPARNTSSDRPRARELFEILHY